MPQRRSERVEAHRSALREARLRLLRMHHESGVGHIGGNLSALDATLFLHQQVMEAGDSFVLAKGHSIGALYVTLWLTGELSDAQLKDFHGEGSKLAGHPVPGWTPGIPVAMGSLGHGLPVACGMALASRFNGHSGRVFCLTSDGEWQEGSNWEALIFARHQRLENLTVLVDANRLQGFGNTSEVASMDDLGARLRGFDVTVTELDGHDPEALHDALVDADPGLRVLLLHTIKGKGVSFMENEMKWHYLPLDAELYARAVRELEN